MVARALPGERVRARITNSNRRYALAEKLETLRPSPDAVCCSAWIPALNKLKLEMRKSPYPCMPTTAGSWGTDMLPPRHSCELLTYLTPFRQHAAG